MIDPVLKLLIECSAPVTMLKASSDGPEVMLSQLLLMRWARQDQVIDQPADQEARLSSFASWFFSIAGVSADPSE
ncbi:MAG: hypothetical protein AAF788_04370 [Pseudomonadota bacterium]